MVEQSVALGYDYIALTDHSISSGAAGGLTPPLLRRQRREIDALRNRFPEIAILHGAEVDILPDGRLDFEDEVLAELDIVLASLHDAAGHDGGRLTERYLTAIRHPLVTIVTHPTNREIGRRCGYALDFPALFAAAAETGTALEVDGAPVHLDMDGVLVRQAVAAGVTVTIDSDAHGASRLDPHMQFGIGTARRGWVEARHVLNTRPLADVRAFVDRKRRRQHASSSWLLVAPPAIVGSVSHRPWAALLGLNSLDGLGRSSGATCCRRTRALSPLRHHPGLFGDFLRHTGGVLRRRRSARPAG
jgi:DNA polymerase (family 10)